MKKTSTIANFNCTFGKNNLPMLTYFKEIVYPAFKSDFTRDVGEDKYFFDEVKIINKRGRYVLQGILVRKTRLEVKTQYLNGEVKYTNKFYDTAPISIFSLYLDNHRLIYTTNQKGSPNIRSFSATVRESIKNRVKEYNKDLDKEKRIPHPTIDIVNIPEKSNIYSKLKKVEKISKLYFKFFIPNGDIETKDAYDWILSELDDYGSKSGELIIKSPTNFSTVGKRIEESNGYALVNMEVKYKGGGEGKLDNSSMTEKFTIDVPDGSTIETVANITLETLNSNAILNKVESENQKIYNENKRIISTMVQ